MRVKTMAKDLKWNEARMNQTLSNRVKGEKEYQNVSATIYLLTSISNLVAPIQTERYGQV